MGNEEKLDHIINEMVVINKKLTMLTDEHLTRAALAKKWGVSDETITNYTKLANDPMPKLKNGRYPYLDCVAWLYESPISETLKGQEIIEIIKAERNKK